MLQRSASSMFSFCSNNFSSGFSSSFSLSSHGSHQLFRNSHILDFNSLYLWTNQRYVSNILTNQRSVLIIATNQRSVLIISTNHNLLWHPRVQWPHPEFPENMIIFIVVFVRDLRQYFCFLNKFSNFKVRWRTCYKLLVWLHSKNDLKNELLQFSSVFNNHQMEWKFLVQMNDFLISKLLPSSRWQSFLLWIGSLLESWFQEHSWEL